MSKIAFCPRGGQGGILVTEQQLRIFSYLLKTKSFDEVIPLPDIFADQQKTRILEDYNNGAQPKHDEHSQQYWEMEKTGVHGWCCAYCGVVLHLG